MPASLVVSSLALVKPSSVYIINGGTLSELLTCFNKFN